MNRFWRDSSGATLLQFTVVFPLFMLVVLGTIDVALLLFDWSLAGKATYRGARMAVVTAPVASGITAPTYATVSTQSGTKCFDPATGNNNATANCPTVSTVCTPAASNGTCTNSYNWNETAFTAVLGRMQQVFPRIGRQNVVISYQTSGLGYVGRPNGLPMNVTVSLRCMSHRFYFISALMGWAFPNLPNTCPAPLTTGGPILPAFTTTLTSEDMTTN